MASGGPVISTMGGARVGRGVLRGAVVGHCGHSGHGDVRCAVGAAVGAGAGECQASLGSQDSVAGDGARCGASKATWEKRGRLHQAFPKPIGSMVLLYMVTFTINIPQMLVYHIHGSYGKQSGTCNLQCFQTDSLVGNKTVFADGWACRTIRNLINQGFARAWRQQSNPVLIQASSFRGYRR